MFIEAINTLDKLQNSHYLYFTIKLKSLHNFSGTFIQHNIILHNWNVWGLKFELQICIKNNKKKFQTTSAY